MMGLPKNRDQLVFGEVRQTLADQPTQDSTHWNPFENLRCLPHAAARTLVVRDACRSRCPCRMWADNRLGASLVTGRWFIGRGVRGVRGEATEGDIPLKISDP
jgi:hypothetical protein